MSTFHQRSQAHEEGTHKGCPYRDWRREGEGALWYTCGDDSDRLRSLCRDYTFDQTAGPARRHWPAVGSGRSDDNPPDRGGRAAHRPRAGAGYRRRYAHPHGHALGLCGAGGRCLCPAFRQPSLPSWLQTDISGCRAWRARLCLGAQTGGGEAGVHPFTLGPESTGSAGPPVSDFAHRAADRAVHADGNLQLCLRHGPQPAHHDHHPPLWRNSTGHRPLFHRHQHGSLAERTELGGPLAISGSLGVRINRSAFLRHSRNMDRQSAQSTGTVRLSQRLRGPALDRR